MLDPRLSLLRDQAAQEARFSDTFLLLMGAGLLLVGLWTLVLWPALCWLGRTVREILLAWWH